MPAAAAASAPATAAGSDTGTRLIRAAPVTVWADNHRPDRDRAKKERRLRVKPGPPFPCVTQRAVSAPVRYRAEPGVVGRIEQCDGTWCHIEIGKRQGFIAQSDIWGASEGEAID